MTSGKTGKVGIAGEGVQSDLPFPNSSESNGSRPGNPNRFNSGTLAERKKLSGPSTTPRPGPAQPLQAPPPAAKSSHPGSRF